MQLKDFTANTIETATEAKNFLSFLIGYNFNKKNTGKSLIALYESFSEEIKNQPKILAPSIFKFFSTYEITTENHEVYKKFLPFWSPKEKEVVKVNNKNWNFEDELTVYKNSLEFCRTLQRISSWNRNPIEGIKFLNDNQDVVSQLILKDKQKFQDNMEKIDAWETLIINDYSYFKKFCKNRLDEKNILFQSLEKNPLIICALDDKHFSYMLKDIKDYQIFDNFNCEIASDILVGLIIRKKHLNAAHFRIELKDKIDESINVFFENKNNSLSCMKKENLNTFCEEYFCKNKNTMSWYNLDKSKENLDDFFNFSDKFEFREILEKKLESKNKITTKKMKI